LSLLKTADRRGHVWETDTLIIGYMGYLSLMLREEKAHTRDQGLGGHQVRGSDVDVPHYKKAEAVHNRFLRQLPLCFCTHICKFFFGFLSLSFTSILSSPCLTPSWSRGTGAALRWWSHVSPRPLCVLLLEPNLCQDSRPVTVKLLAS
jgi:hypothetical protein